MHYQFGDQDLAARRLEVVARVFEPTTRELLEQSRLGQTRIAIDLGCGPGFTTRLLGEVAGRAIIVGLDSSERFLTLARRPAADRLSFQHHDVSTTPLPHAPADLLFCRFLLSHLPDPRSCLEKWATQVNQGGLIVVEEVEAIESTQPAFQNYLGIVESLLRNQRTELYVGPLLASLAGPPPLRKRSSRARRLPVSNQDAATMFSMNLPNWKDNPFIRENFSAASIGRLQRDLEELASAAGKESSIAWTLRQLVFERPEADV
jgi:ubiquinone/menaquinone biosynthesis C-methylase UbiE